MIMSKNLPGQRFDLRCGGLRVEQVDQFQYLGRVVMEDVRCETEIKRRIGIAKGAFGNMK